MAAWKLGVHFRKLAKSCVPDSKSPDCTNRETDIFID